MRIFSIIRVKAQSVDHYMENGFWLDVLDDRFPYRELLRRYFNGGFSHIIFIKMSGKSEATLMFLFNMIHLTAIAALF